MFTAFAGADLPTSADLPEHGRRRGRHARLLHLDGAGNHPRPADEPAVVRADRRCRRNLRGARLGRSRSPPSFPTDQRPGLFTRALFVAAGRRTLARSSRAFTCVATSSATRSGGRRRQAANAIVAAQHDPDDAPGRRGADRLAPPAAVATPATSTRSASRRRASTASGGSARKRRCTRRRHGGGAPASRYRPAPRTCCMGDDATAANGAGGLDAHIDASNKPAACLTRNYFRYTFGRFEDLSLDGCSLEMIRKNLDGGGHWSTC